jgi:ABC-2 type transport system ATP-binding protein
MNALEVEGLRKVFKARRRTVTAVDGISFTVRPGEIYGFLGPNGAGKTTTIKMACGLLNPESGTVRVMGHDVQRQRRAALRHIGAVLEGNRNVYWRLSPYENLLYFATLKAVPIPNLRGRIEEMLHFFDIWEKRGDMTMQLSRGMQQKVAIACALIHDPDVLLLDEPTLGLDIQAARMVEQRIAELAHEQGKTIILTTHQMELAQKVCDRVAIINQGRIAAEDRVENLIRIFSVQEYRLRFAGRHEQRLREVVNHSPRVEISELPDATALTIIFEDPNELYPLMAKLDAAALPLAGVEKVEPNLADVFLRVIEGKDPPPPSPAGNGRPEAGQ